MTTSRESSPDQFKMFDDDGNSLVTPPPAVEAPHDTPYIEQTGSYDRFDADALPVESVFALGNQALGGKGIERIVERTDDYEQDRRNDGTYDATQPDEQEAAFDRSVHELPRFHRPRRESIVHSQTTTELNELYDYSPDRDNPAAAVQRGKDELRKRNIAPRLKGSTDESAN